MRRLVFRLLSLYLLFAVIGRFVEGMGAVVCGCDPSCWCHKPVLSTFRWVFPYGHRGQGCGDSAVMTATPAAEVPPAPHPTP